MLGSIHVTSAAARCALAVLTALPLVLLLVPVTYLAFLGLRMRLAPAVVVLVALGFIGLMPQLSLVMSRKGKPTGVATHDVSSDYSAVSGGSGA